MDIIEKIGDTITEKGKVAADKAKELAAIANLKSQISTCEEVMKKNYLEIGKIYFEQYSDMPEPPFEKQCETIKNSQRAIADLQEKIEQLKNKIKRNDENKNRVDNNPVFIYNADITMLCERVNI